MDSCALIRKHLGDKPLREIRAAAEASRVPFRTLLRIAKGRTLNPRVASVQPVVEWLNKQRAA